MGWDRHELLWDGMGQKKISHGQACGFITAAPSCFDAYPWYLSEEMAFFTFFQRSFTVNETDQCRKEMLQYKPKSSLALQKLSKVVIPELKKCTKIIKPIWTRFISDSGKNGNSTNFFGSASFAMGKRFHIQLFEESSE